MMAMRPWVPDGRLVEASAATGPAKAAAPTVAPVALRKSRRVSRIFWRSSWTTSTDRPVRFASSKSSARAKKRRSSGVRAMDSQTSYVKKQGPQCYGSPVLVFALLSGFSLRNVQGGYDLLLVVVGVV